MEARTTGQRLPGSADMPWAQAEYRACMWSLANSLSCFSLTLTCGYPEGEHLQIRMPFLTQLGGNRHGRDVDPTMQETKTGQPVGRVSDCETESPSGCGHCELQYSDRAQTTIPQPVLGPGREKLFPSFW